jgi:phosphoenolpyruvate carboxykinase (ATP)
MVRAILDGALGRGEFDVDPRFGFAVPVRVPGVPTEILQPRQTWRDPEAFDATATRLARDLAENFAQFAGKVPAAVAAAGPTSK